MKLQFKLTLLFLLVVLTVFAQKKAIESITENELRTHLEFIASDLMQGRDFDTEIPGLEISANYLKSQITQMGLDPGDNNYFQEFKMISVKADPKNTFIELQNKSGNTVYENDSIFAYVGTDENEILEGELVFAGYGWTDSVKGYDDVESLDIKNKLVLIMTRNYELAKDTTQEFGIDIYLESSKIELLLTKGAKGILMVQDPINPDHETMGWIKDNLSKGICMLEGEKRPAMPGKVITITSSIADNLLKSKGKTLRELQELINKTEKPHSFGIEDYKVNLTFGKVSKSISGKNVIGIIEGSNPVLKNECIVFTAHYDHLGINDNGEVFNGADDNGTGTAALLEIAEAFQSMKKKPKRSIVFAWVAAEEKGLIGSDYYSQHPVIPLENTLLDINLDMVGRSAETEPAKDAEMSNQLAGSDGIYIVSGKQSTELMGISDDVCKELGLLPSDELTKAFLTRSDYYHFYKNGVPILGLSTGMHDDYHKTTDELDKIDYTKMKRVAQYGFLVAHKVANQKKRIVVDKPVAK